MAAQRRQAVEHLKTRRGHKRRACRLVSFGHSAAWYRPQGREDAHDAAEGLSPRFGRPMGAAAPVFRGRNDVGRLAVFPCHRRDLSSLEY